LKSFGTSCALAHSPAIRFITSSCDLPQKLHLQESINPGYCGGKNDG
jgi:hypothetical protein